jgi:uncharacterized membrane protein
MSRLFKKCAPSIHRYWLYLIAGTLWLGVGIALIVVACYWLSGIAWPWNLSLAACSSAVGFIVYSHGFSRIARKNIKRIAGQPDMACIFTFQGPRSYYLILVMMLLGFTIRHLPVPKYIIAPIYFIMGSALAFSSSLYFHEFSKE